MTDPRASPQSPDVHASAAVEPLAAPAPAEIRAIYREHFAYVWRSLRRLGVAERHLEDLAHDVFIALVKTYGDYDRSRPIKPWLFGIAFRVASDHARRASTRREVLDDAPEAPDLAPAAHERLEAEDARRLVHAALDTLDLDRRAVIVLHDIEERPATEIAEVLGIPVNTVYSRLRIARERFAKAVERHRRRGGEA